MLFKYMYFSYPMFKQKKPTFLPKEILYKHFLFHHFVTMSALKQFKIIMNSAFIMITLVIQFAFNLAGIYFLCVY